MKIVAKLFLGMVTALGGLPAGSASALPIKVLDKTAILNSYARGDNAWYVENIPFFDCPDKDLRDIYYYRWWNLRHNIHWDARAKAWTIHEGGGYGIVPCALGHHVYEGRWLRDRAYVRDDLRFWFAGFDNPRRYSNWVADACYAWYLVEFDKALALSFLDRLKANYAAWEREHFDAVRGLFKWVPDRDGMEASVAGFEQGAGDGFRWNTVIFGGEGYRPSLCSYMAADAAAIARLAELAGDRATAETFSRKADSLRRKILGELWNPEKQFFMQRRASDYQFVGGREEIGFFPWAFHVPDNTDAFSAAWKQLVAPQGFHAKYGPTTLERRNPYCLRPFQHGCLWNGPSWPYSTSVTLAALANLLNDYTQSVVTRDDYVALLKNYAATQHDPDGKPMVREDHHPDENRWLAQGPNYNHSRYCDLVITGLVGLRPRSDNALTVNPLVPPDWDYFCLEDIKYHGRSVTILYDRTGRKYGRGTGLRLLVDGREAAAAATVSKLTVALDGNPGKSPRIAIPGGN